MKENAFYNEKSIYKSRAATARKKSVNNKMKRENSLLNNMAGMNENVFFFLHIFFWFFLNGFGLKIGFL